MLLALNVLVYVYIIVSIYHITLIAYVSLIIVVYNRVKVRNCILFKKYASREKFNYTSIAFNHMLLILLRYDILWN